MLRSRLSRVVVGLLSLVAPVVGARSARAEGVFIPASNRVDVAYDAIRHKVYVSNGNQLLKFDTDGEFAMPPVQFSGNLGGMDISPDGNTLAIANRTGGASGPLGSFFLYNLASGTSRQVNFSTSPSENGVWTVAYGSDGKLLLTTRYSGSGWVSLRRYDPVTDQVTQVTNSSAIRQDTMLTASGDRSVIGLAESNSSDGPWGVFKVSTGALTSRNGYADGTSWFNYEIGVNNNGTQFSVPTYGGTFVYNAAYQKIATIGAYASGQPIGVAYHPSQPKIYFPWAGSNEIRVYSSDSFQPIGTYNFESVFTHPGNHAFDNGRTKVAADGSLLLSTVNGGVRYVRLTPSSTTNATSQSISLPEDSSRAITLTQGVGTYSIIAQPTKGTLTGTAPNVTYTPYANYYGADSFVFAIESNGVRSTATVSITVTGVADVPVAFEQSLDTPQNTAVPLVLRATDGDDNGLSYSIVTSPTKGVLSGTAPNLTYTPNSGEFGTDFFSFKVNDGFYTSNTAKIWVNIAAPAGAPPTAISNLFRVNRGSTLTVPAPGVLANDSDPEGAALRAVLFNPPTKATDFVFNDNGSFTWTGGSFSWQGTYSSDSFTYKASDGTQMSSATTVVIVLNDPPTADVVQNYTVVEDTPRSIRLNATDRQQDNITYEVLTQPTRGTLTGTAPNLTYVPALNYSGSDSFSWRASDGMAQSNIITNNLVVTPVNDAPVAASQNISLNEDGSQAITLSGSDVENSPLTYTVVSGPSKGTLTGVAPNLTYTPNANFNGADSFTFKVNDGGLDSAPATVSVNVLAVADTPLAASQSVTTDEDTAKPVNLLATDEDGDTLSYTITSGPAHGSLTGNGAELTYTPAPNYFGSDEFTFKANDGTQDSNLATVSIAVTGVNDAPVATTQSVSTDEDSTLEITLSGTDADGDALTYAVVGEPAHGTLTGTAPSLSYTPAANFNGGDNFTFKVSDGTLESAEATVSINVNSASDSPVAVSDTYQTNEDETLIVAAPGVLANDRDEDGESLTAVLSQNAANGTVTLNADGSFTYTPDVDWNGTDTFQYVARDGFVDSSAVTVTVKVAAVNDAPVALAQGIETEEDTAKTLSLTGVDAENDALTFTVQTQPGHGTLSGTAPNLTYTPAPDYFGTDSFTFKVSDGTLESAPATLSILVNGVNDAPVATGQTVSTLEDTAKGITLGATDLEGSALTYIIVAAPTKGTLTGSGANRTYTPSLNANGSDSFTFKANDGALDSNVVTIGINISPVNDAPEASASSVTTLEDSAKVIALNASDIDGDALTYTIVTQPTKGTLSGSGASRTYTPNLNSNGSDSFSWRATDATLNSSTVTTNITITPVNDAPTANALSVTTSKNSAATITLTGGDVDNDALTYVIVSNPTKGTLSGSGANRTYTPNNNFTGSDSFTFKTRDTVGSESAVATVSISVTGTLAPSVLVTYKITSQWNNGFTADVFIKNNGLTPINNWTLAWAFTGDQKITNLWNGTLTQSGKNVSVKDATWNKLIAPGATQSIGFQATFSGTNAKPTSFTLNGVATAVG